MIFANKLNLIEQQSLEFLRCSFEWSNDQLDYLIACMMFESGLNPQAVNKISGAVGLIQFMPRTARDLGTSTEELFAMPFVAQIHYVSKYFKPYHKKVKTISDMYMAILMPSAIGKKDNENIFKTNIQYFQNKGLDLNKDGIITKAEASQKVINIYNQAKKFK